MALNAVPMPGLQERADMLDTILALSEDMLGDARDGRWDRMTAREPERQRLVWKFFERPLSRGEAVACEPGLRRVLEISQELTRLAQAERQALAGQVHRLDQARRAERAYRAQAAPRPAASGRA